MGRGGLFPVLDGKGKFHNWKGLMFMKLLRYAVFHRQILVIIFALQ